MIAVVGWLLFSQDDRVLKTLWILQLVFNALWSWLFFGQHWVSLALLDIVALGVVLVILIFACLTRGQRLAGYLLLPYLIWIMLASSLNGYVVLYN
jgi:tryptophan-rich sensory protein